MRRLFVDLNKLRRRAEGQAGRDRLSHLVDREQQLFVRDHPRTATREEVANLLERVEALLDSSLEAEAIQRSVQRIRRQHQLEDEPNRAVDDIAALTQSLASLKDSLRIERSAETEPMSPKQTETAPVAAPEQDARSVP